MAEHYRDFDIRHELLPIPVRDLDWSATHKDYDGDGDNRHFRAATIEALKAEIDDWHDA